MSSDGASKPALLDTLIDKLLAGIGGEQREQSDSEQSSLITLDDLFIRTKKKQLIPFRPNEVQIKYLDDLAPGWREDDLSFTGIKDILLKARQFGFSTLIEALFFCDTINTPNTATVVIAHDRETTERLFRMVHLFYEHLPPHKKPEAKYASKREFYWPSINSSFFVGTAGAGSFGRSATINNLHCSEVAFFPNPEELMTGLLQAVPEDGNIFLETTANGLGNWYHQEYTLAESGNSTFRAKFFGWNEHPEYQLKGVASLPPAASKEERDREERLTSVYSLSMAQLAWRRKKMREPGMAAKFVQEYPINAREAFVASGNPYFNRDILEAISDQLEAGEHAPLTGYEIPLQLGPELENGNLLRKEKDFLEVFELPRPGRIYVIGADTAEGLNDEGDHDFDAAVVLDAETWEEVARLLGQWDTHSYGIMLAQLGYWYNTAILGIERNNHGHAVINAALHTAKYPEMSKGSTKGLYKHEEWDENKKFKQMKLGWPTTPKTKYFALDGLATSIENSDITIKDRSSIGQLLTFVKLPGGKAGGEGKSHDDLVIAWSIADAICKLRPRADSAPQVEVTVSEAASYTPR